MVVTSHRPYQPMCLARTTTCQSPVDIRHSTFSFHSSDLEDSHVIPGLIHKCYLAKSTVLHVKKFGYS